MGQNEVVLLFLLSFSHHISIVPELCQSRYCGSPRRCLDLERWLAAPSASNPAWAHGSAKRDARRIYILQSALPSHLHNPPVKWAKPRSPLCGTEPGAERQALMPGATKEKELLSPDVSSCCPCHWRRCPPGLAGQDLHRLGSLCTGGVFPKAVCRLCSENPLSSALIPRCARACLT